MMYNLINGDCLEVLPTFDDNVIDYTFTSPPYNRKRNDKYEHYDDNVDDWFEWNKRVINELLRVTKKHIFYNVQANYYNRKDVYSLIGFFSDKIVDIHIWEKTNPLPASGYFVTNAIEYFIVFGDESLTSNNTYTKNKISTSVNSNMPKEHKAVMKPEVAEHFIRNFTKEGNIILDCFMGLGTTGVCSLENNRNFIGIELKKDYFDVAESNINNIIKKNKIIGFDV